MVQINPVVWNSSELETASQLSIDDFKHQRAVEPLELYLELFKEYQYKVDELLKYSMDLSQLSDRAIEYLCDPALCIVVRYLASPPISEDDLKVLANAVLAPNRLRSDPAMAHRIISTVLLSLDRNRFPWLAENRMPTCSERQAAVISTTSLIATQRVQTTRRSAARDTQEESLVEYLKTIGFTMVRTRDIPNSGNLPAPGEFCRESSFGGRKADLVIRLWDGRTMPVECKVSNSSTNSVKRLNNDAVVKAGQWLKKFGTEDILPTALLAGVFKVRNLQDAQSKGLYLYWSHDLAKLGEFIESLPA